MFAHHSTTTSSAASATSSSSSSSCPSIPATMANHGEAIAGSLTLQQLFIIVSIACGAITLIVTLLNIFKHLHRYSAPNEQRQIVRIIFTPVVYAVVAIISIISYPASQYIEPFAALYEAFAVAAIFLLFVNFVAPDAETREVFFHNVMNKDKHGNPVPGGSAAWFKRTWVSIFQFPIVATILTIVQLVTTAMGTYCVVSNKVHFAHIWVTSLMSLATAVAVMAVLRFYGKFKKEMKPRGALGKLITFKLIVFLNFVQSLAFSVLSGKLNEGSGGKVTGPDLSIGVPQILVAVEQVFFAIGMHFAFNSKPYSGKVAGNQTMGFFRAAANAFNPIDLFFGFLKIFSKGSKPAPQYAPQAPQYQQGYNNGGGRLNGPRYHGGAPQAQYDGRG